MSEHPEWRAKLLARRWCARRRAVWLCNDLGDGRCFAEFRWTVSVDPCVLAPRLLTGNAGSYPSRPSCVHSEGALGPDYCCSAGQRSDCSYPTWKSFDTGVRSIRVRCFSLLGRWSAWRELRFSHQKYFIAHTSTSHDAYQTHN